MLGKLAQYFGPKTLATHESSVNGTVYVKSWHGKLIVEAGGVYQSSPYHTRVWTKFFQDIDCIRYKPESILMLGVGGGSVIEILSDLFPMAHMTAVDIDPVMIRIVQRYRSLPSNVRLTVEDASRFVRKTRRKYDLILNDLSVGPRVPEFVTSLLYCRSIRSLMTETGKLSINFSNQSKRVTESYEETLARVFPSVERFDIEHNTFFAAGIT